nr:MAG: ORF1 [TTV-like mini virus]
MPYFWRRARYRRRRPRWFNPWRFRRPFRRRRYRRYRVRKYKRKLPKITLQQWQPPKINKTTVRGFYPLFLATKERLSNNMTQWLESTAPPHFPGGGGFSLIQFTLQSLYEQFLRATNWWTKSNCNLPLIKYRGCMLKFYRTEKFDYNVIIERCYPLKANDMMYLSTQPAIMGLTKKCIHIPCRQNSQNKRNYKKVWVKPPTQMTSGWHFQKDLANFPLFIIRTAATSFDRYYLSSKSQSSTIGFTSLNTRFFKLHDWQDPPTTGYRPSPQMYVWGTINGEADPLQEKVENLIYLGGTGKLQKGEQIKTHKTNYATTPGYWGNIFHPDYLTGTSALLFTNKTINDIVQYANSNPTKSAKESTYFTIRTEPLLVECRYNPFSDKSKNNKTYVVSNHSDHTEWQPPPDKQDVIRQNLPLWLETWGHLDFLRKAQLVSQVDINYIYVIQSDHIQSTPKLPFYVPVDSNFTDSPPSSPYIENLNASDTLHFYPKVTFQIKTINLIATSGPGTIKLQDQQSCEAHVLYNFKFKVGGCPSNMETLCDPEGQPKYPIPDFKQNSTSLQSPATAIQTYLWDFDERRGIITDRAAKRIKKDQGTETFTFPFTGSPMDIPAPYQSPSQSDEETSEESEAQTTFKLLQLRHQQHLLRQRILNLISQNSE